MYFYDIQEYLHIMFEDLDLKYNMTYIYQIT